MFFVVKVELLGMMKFYSNHFLLMVVVQDKRHPMIYIHLFFPIWIHIEKSSYGTTNKTWSVRPWQQNQEMISTTHHTKRDPCHGLWMTPVIRHDGELLLCCADLQSQMSLGNLHQTSFMNLWTSSKAVQKRMEHLQGSFKGVCKDCGGVIGIPSHKTEKSKPRNMHKSWV